MAWTQLTLEQIHFIFGLSSSDRKPIEAFRALRIDQKNKTPYVSIIKDRKTEFEKLEIGKELLITILAQTDSQPDDDKLVKRYLAQTYASQTILECVVYDQEELNYGDQLVVEITRQMFAPPRLVVVPAGSRRYALDLPLKMLQGPVSFGPIRPEFQTFLDTLHASEQELTASEKLDVASLTDTELDQCLALAYRLGTKSEIEFQYRILAVEEWVSRNRKALELEVHNALMAILILHENSQVDYETVVGLMGLPYSIVRRTSQSWGKSAVELSQEIGRRALRSFHTEILQQYWFNSDSGNHLRTDGLWQRLQLLKPYLMSLLTPGDFQKIDQFCRAVSLRYANTASEDNPIVLLADSLSFAIGRASNVTHLRNYSDVVAVLTFLHATLPVTVSKYPAKLHESHLKQISQLLDFIATQGLDITLLDPIPLVTKDIY